jgi:hypothetical protein
MVKMKYDGRVNYEEEPLIKIQGLNIDRSDDGWLEIFKEVGREPTIDYATELEIGRIEAASNPISKRMLIRIILQEKGDLNLALKLY